jgi:drug/metabolite transporter (DMT)-like permease
VRAKTKAISTLAWVSIIWGTTWLASKQGVKYIPALQMAGMRQFIAGVCYITFFLLKKVPLPRGTEWRSILLLSFLNFMLSNGLSTWGIKYISSGLGSIIAAIFPLWIVIIEMVRGRKLPRLAVTGLLTGYASLSVRPSRGRSGPSILKNTRRIIIPMLVSATKCLFQEFPCCLFLI